MPITSFIIQTLPEQIESVSAIINNLDGATITERQDCKLIVITETTTSEQNRELLNKMEQLQGVITVNAIYHNFEDLGEDSQ